MANNFKTVGKPIRKKDAMSLLLGKPAYLDDLTTRQSLGVSGKDNFSSSWINHRST